jgi:hypothetical protein
VQTVPRSWKWSAGAWQPDVTGSPSLSSAQLRALAGLGSELTVLGVPVGSGTRMGRDRDRDGFPDGDERAAGSDPGDPASTPATVGVDRSARATGLRPALPNPFRGSARFDLTLARAGRAELVIYDVLGREVRVLMRGVEWPAGSYSLDWDGRREGGGRAGAGFYFAKLRTAEGSWVKTVVKLE